jgi:hypothetical protein
MIAEINEQNINGILPQEAWSWFYMDHHEKHELPQSDWRSLSELGGLLPSPTKKS